MRKLTLSLILVVVVSVIGWGWGISQYYAHLLEENSQHYHEEFQLYETLGKTMVMSLENDDEPHTYLERWRRENDVQISLVALDDLPLPPSLTQGFQNGDAVALETGEDVSLYFHAPKLAMALELTVPLVKLQKMKVPVNLWLTLLFYGGIVAVILLWLSPLVNRLKSLRKMAIEFGGGNLEARVDPTKISYIADIEREFNRMADRIQALVEDNKLLSRAVSHDLKTPLARLRFGFETLSETDNQQQRDRYQQRIEKDLDEMESLVDTLLQFARLDESNLAFTFLPVDLAELVQHCAETQTSGECTPTIVVEGETTIKGDRKYLQMLINNLYANALNYCDKKIQVRITGTPKSIELCVEDDGMGIPEEERKSVIKPFYRGKNLAREKGHGMGLAIVSKIADWHDGSLKIAVSEKLHGAMICVKFPC